ncbi:MAG: C-GCAxxG-C-C family protein, partial [Kiritimatiellales bacterium]|nr:C-GCAxxG-C-C family protein [Kiritimatiellales bacterium]
MDRRKAMIMATGAAAGGGACILALTTAFKPKIRPADQPKKLESGNANPDWKYIRLNPATTADLAYGNYVEGSCMYAVCKSVVSQLADQFGEPYSSFPCHMMKYGHGGIGGFGTVCGALNGAAAIIGLLVADKESQNALITDLFRWYEQTPLPKSSPSSPRLDFAPPASTAGSALCHASTTNWANVSGYGIGSKQ